MRNFMRQGTNKFQSLKTEPTFEQKVGLRLGVGLQMRVGHQSSDWAYTRKPSYRTQ